MTGIECVVLGIWKRIDRYALCIVSSIVVVLYSMGCSDLRVESSRDTTTRPGSVGCVALRSDQKKLFRWGY